MSRKRIVILGGGFGGGFCAQELQSRLSNQEAEVILLDRNNYFIFYPLLVEAGTGSLEPRHAVVSIRSFLKGASFIMGTATDVDPHARVVRYRVPMSPETFELTYDHLVLSVGSVTMTPDVPGLKEHGFQMKSLADAVALRDRAIRMLECANATPDRDSRRSMIHFVVVGANFTGAEVAGEFFNFLRNAAKAYPNVNRRDVAVTLIELKDRILQALDQDLSAYAAQRMRSWGVGVRLNESVTEIEAERVRLKSGDTIPSRTVIWCAGIAPNPIVEQLPFQTDEHGYVATERDLRVRGHSNVWAIGDCAANPDPRGVAYPATAQHAVRQARRAAQNIVCVLRGQPPRPCNIRSHGSLVALGCRTGVAKVFGIKVSGFAAWWLHRTVYLMKMPGLARKLRVALDWSMDLVFPRDYVQLDVHSVRRERNRDSGDAQ